MAAGFGASVSPSLPAEDLNYCKKEGYANRTTRVALRIPHSQRYRLIAEGLCIALAYYRTQSRVLGPVLSATLDGESTTRLQAAVAAYDREVGHLWEGQPLAA